MPPSGSPCIDCMLNRVASLVRRRGYNIESLTVGHTDVADVSRITLVLDATLEAASRIEANLYKLVDVRRVEHVTTLPSVCRDLALVKVAATATRGARSSSSPPSSARASWTSRPIR